MKPRSVTLPLPRKRSVFRPLMITMSAVSLLAGAFWYMSPLGMGFVPGPQNPVERALILGIYRFTYFFGIPLLLATAPVSIMLDAKGFERLARTLPSVIFPIWFGLVAIVILRWN